MSSKKDADLREALEIAFFILKNIDAPEGFDNRDALLVGEPDDVDRLADRLVKDVLGHDKEIDCLLQSLSPRWLLERLGVDNEILLKLAFARIVLDKASPRFVVSQLIGLAEEKGRGLAFQTLYSLSFMRSPDLAEARRVYSLCASDLEGRAEPEGYAWNLVRGVWSNEKEINRLIGKFSRNWRLDRMGVIERIALQIAFYELFFLRESPKKVARDAAELAGRFGVGGATKFITGILAACGKAIESG
ncbi:MAG: transcription antitermination protein NusB, partial [Desulfovibrio sp.]|nr:transcription antitermination protein NusB [Desulfovibrio sp.]